MTTKVFLVTITYEDRIFATPSPDRASALRVFLEAKKQIEEKLCGIVSAKFVEYGSTGSILDLKFVSVP